MMVDDNQNVTYVSFDNDWKFYFQEANDETDENTVIFIANNKDTNKYWTEIELPHVIDTKKHGQSLCKYWYEKSFDWMLKNEYSRQKIYLNFEFANDSYEFLTNQVSIWFNNTNIFSNSFRQLKDCIELPSKLFHYDGEIQNTLVICSQNKSLNVHVHIIVYGELICATGNISSNETNLQQHHYSDKKPNDSLNYSVNVDSNYGRIDLVFNPKSKHKTILSSQNSSSLIDNNDDKQSDELRKSHDSDYEDDLLVPRLAIVILIVGTRGDVQPFIALGQALRSVGHRVRLATHETFRTFVRGNGLEFYPLAGDPADLMSFMVKNSGIIPSLNSIIEGDISKKRRSMAEILVSTWKACIENDDETQAPFTADVIIANPPSFGHFHCAEKLQIPLHIMFTMPWSPTTAFPHPLANIDNSIGPKAKINLYSYDVIEMLTWTGMRDVINSFRKKTLGLKELHTRQAINVLIDECIPHTYCWSPSLVPKPSDWGSHIDISGFFFLNLGTAYKNPPHDLLEFLGITDDDQRRDDALASPIYIGFGSITGHDSNRILRVVIDALHQTGYRAVLSGLATDDDQLPPAIFRIGNVPHDWLFQYVSAVCHHGGAGTTAAGLRAGKPTIIVPFFGDQFFWGKVIEKSGAGPCPLPGKSIKANELAEAFHFVHKRETRRAAECIRDEMSKENGCSAAIHALHKSLPLKRLHSDLEPTFAACYRLKKYNLQISRPVAQVLVVAGVINELELQSHVTKEWTYMHKTRTQIPTHGIIEHSQKAFASIVETSGNIKRAGSDENVALEAIEDAGQIVKGFGLGLGHFTIGCLSLYGEITDVLDRATYLYDPYSNPKERLRPRVTDFKSGAKAAGLALWRGWKEGLTGIVTQPRIGYERHGIVGGAAGSLIGTVNAVVKPSVGALSSITWLSRGTYASVEKAIETYNNEGRRISRKLFDTTSTKQSIEEARRNNTDEEYISPAAQMASEISGFHPRVCQLIIDEFKKIKAEQDEQENKSSNENRSDIKTFFTNISETFQDLLPLKNSNT